VDDPFILADAKFEPIQHYKYKLAQEPGLQLYSDINYDAPPTKINAGSD
jgi:hypothetical protein